MGVVAESEVAAAMSVPTGVALLSITIPFLILYLFFNTVACGEDVPE